jgi:hypothetical protein
VLHIVWAASSISLKFVLLRLSQWAKDFNYYSQKQTHASIWIRLVEWPQEYRKWTLKEIESAVGTLIDLDTLTRNRAFIHYVRTLMDIYLYKRAFDEIPVEHEGFSFKVEVYFEWRPLFYDHCYVIGHNIYYL